MPGKLYIVPTPVGNLADMAPRAIEILRSASLILAEDTRTSAVLMRHFGISTPMASHHKFNEHKSLDPVLDRIAAGETIALVSDAGTPGISDPGFMLSRECRHRNLPVETLPGPTAFVPALVNSGLPCDRFFFEGFLPAKKGRASRLEFLASLPVSFVIYESPLRVARTLASLAEACGDERPAAVCREISKIHDTTHRGTLAELCQYFELNNARGEIVIVVGGLERPKGEDRRHKNKYKTDLPDLP
ncbi:MAG: 16S rRNA (cytidine(1402)-2'-O)-methyltransferase, partial [Muribaculaceae bacterium]|nr:16S rRNA (cytidine(1402)-2'-O)-methyltransferase [Muribaculaceae bacterium]